MTELTRTINNVNDITSLQEIVTINTTNISTLQSYAVSNGTNFGQNVLQDLTTGYENTALGNDAGMGTYGLTTGSGNVMIGYNSGGGCVSGSNNTFLGANTQFTGATYIVGSIALGEGATVTQENQLMVASNIAFFNISGLVSGTGTRTILEFDSSGNIAPSVGTYNTVSKIDTELSSLQSSVNTNTSDINTLLSGGTLFTTSGSYTVPSNVTTLTIEAIGGGGGGAGSGSGSSSTGPWSGGGGGSSRCLQKITTPVASGQVIDFTIGSGGSGGAPESSGSDGGTTHNRKHVWPIYINLSRWFRIHRNKWSGQT